jgi:hypothetical protein
MGIAPSYLTDPVESGWIGFEWVLSSVPRENLFLLQAFNVTL